MSEGFAASSQAIAFDSAARCDSGASGPVSPCERHDDPGGVGGLAFVNRRSPESGKELPRTVWLLLLDDFLRDQLQALFLSLFQRGQRLCSDGQEREPHVQPSTLWARVGWISRIGKDLRGHQLVPTAQQGLDRIRHEFLVDRVPLPFGFAQRPKRHRHVMAGGAFARVQPGGAFGLQISNGAIDRLLNLLGSCGRNRSGDCSRHLSSGGRCQNKGPATIRRMRICEP